MDSSDKINEKNFTNNNVNNNIESTDSDVYNKNNYYNDLFVINNTQNNAINYNNNYTQNNAINNINNSKKESTKKNTIDSSNNSVAITDNICNICILKNKYFCCLDKYCKILKIKNFDKFKLKIFDKNSNSEINYILGLSDGRLLICNLDYLIKIIEIDYETKNYIFTNILKGHSNLITKVIELKNGKLCSCSFDGSIKLWKKNIDNSYKLEINLNFFENGKFYSLLEVNEIIFSLLNFENKKFLYFLNLNNKEERIKELNNINLKRENLIQLDNNHLIIGGNYVIYIYEINSNKEIEIKCDYIICSLYLLNDKGILFGDNIGNLVKIKNIYNFEIIFKIQQKIKDEIDPEIDSLGEFDNDNKYFICYKNKKFYNFTEIEIYN